MAFIIVVFAGSGKKKRNNCRPLIDWADVSYDNADWQARLLRIQGANGALLYCAVLSHLRNFCETID
jgi:hypothetical protein